MEPQPREPEDFSSLSIDDLKSLQVELQSRLQTARKFEALTDYRPYPKQREFHDAGAIYRERLLRAGNQLGKTLAAGMELAIHATGRYPDDWKGRRFNQPIAAWAAGVTGESTRDNPQRILLGREYGTGTIPRDALKSVTPARGLAGAMDTIRVRHVSGGVSQIALKSYEKGREKWQGETLDLVWFDEEPPEDIYIEGLTRTNATGGCVFITFTPLQGMSVVVRRFLKDKPLSTFEVSMTIDDVTHFSNEQKQIIIASYSPYEREARTKGIPQLGSGRVFPYSESLISCPGLPIPDHWARIGGMDFGWDHPSAGVLLAHDRDSDCLYVTHAFKAKEQTPVMFAAAVKPWGQWPWAWPHDGGQSSGKFGVGTAQDAPKLAELYRAQGMNMLPTHSTFDDGTYGLEAGVAELSDRMQTGRFKVFAHLREWFEEFSMYYRKDGLIVKEMDDMIAATRYAMMAKRFAKSKRELSRPRLVDVRDHGGSWMG
jgi:phage terminase large subunit-like protein